MAFANSGYVGDPIVLALFGEEALAYYKLYGLPLSIVIYTWGISVLTPNGSGGPAWKRLVKGPGGPGTLPTPRAAADPSQWA